MRFLRKIVLTFSLIVFTNQVWSEDFNVDGQKVLFRYKNSNSNFKNIVEIEVRNDSESKYKSLRFNMYSKDTLYLLESNVDKKIINENLVVFGDAINKFSF